jgi:hypothetical protein
MWTIPSLFKTLTNFTLQKFEELVALIVPTIESHVQSTSDAHIVCGRPTKLTLKQQLLQFILYMKRDNVVMFELCGIGAKVMCGMMQFLFHLALMRL